MAKKEIAPGVTMDSFNKEHIKTQSLEQFLADHKAHSHSVDEESTKPVLTEEMLREVYEKINPIQTAEDSEPAAMNPFEIAAKEMPALQTPSSAIAAGSKGKGQAGK